MHNGNDTEPLNADQMALSSESAEEAHRKCTKSCDIAGHAHEDGLRCKLEGPKPYLFESSLASLFVHNIPSESIVGLHYLLASVLVA